MAYKEHQWDKGELITSEKLNHMELGIAGADQSAAAASASAAEAAQSAAAAEKALEDSQAAPAGYSRSESDIRYSNAMIGKATVDTHLGGGRIGFDFHVKDAAAAALSNLVIVGKSEQAATTGAQLLDPKKMPPSYEDPMPSGGAWFAITLLDNGTYELMGYNGRPEGDPWHESVPYPLSPGSYYVSGCSADGGICFEVDITHADGTVSENVDCAFTVLESDKLVMATVKVPRQSAPPGPNSLWRATLSPMLNAGATAKPWEPYSGGKPSPSLDNPSPIESTGDKEKIYVSTRRGQARFSASLRGIGKYRDRLMRKDGAWGIERNTRTLDSSGWVLSDIAAGTSGHRFKHTYGNAFPLALGDVSVLCSIYPREKADSFTMEGDYISTDDIKLGGNIYIRTLCHDFDTIEAFRSAMANAVTILPAYYTIWEPLPAEAQAALDSLTVPRGDSSINATIYRPPFPDVDVEYVRDINAVIADLQAQIKALKGGK